MANKVKKPQQKEEEVKAAPRKPRERRYSQAEVDVKINDALQREFAKLMAAQKVEAPAVQVAEPVPDEPPITKDTPSVLPITPTLSWWVKAKVFAAKAVLFLAKYKVYFIIGAVVLVVAFFFFQNGCAAHKVVVAEKKIADTMASAKLTMTHVDSIERENAVLKNELHAIDSVVSLREQGSEAATKHEQAVDNNADLIRQQENKVYENILKQMSSPNYNRVELARKLLSAGRAADSISNSVNR